MPTVRFSSVERSLLVVSDENGVRSPDAIAENMLIIRKDELERGMVQLELDISNTNKNGLSFRQTGGTAAGSEESKHFLSAVCSALIFFSFLGAFMNMASLGTSVLTALIPGLLASLLRKARCERRRIMKKIKECTLHRKDFISLI